MGRRRYKRKELLDRGNLKYTQHEKLVGELAKSIKEFVNNTKEKGVNNNDFMNLYRYLMTTINDRAMYERVEYEVDGKQVVGIRITSATGIIGNDYYITVSVKGDAEVVEIVLDVKGYKVTIERISTNEDTVTVKVNRIPTQRRMNGYIELQKKVKEILTTPERDDV